MNEVVVLDSFKRDAKRLQKKYQSLKIELEGFIKQTEESGAQGTSLGGGIFKARIAVKSKGKGKSGGLRLISYQDIILAATDSTVCHVLPQLTQIQGRKSGTGFEVSQGKGFRPNTSG